MENRYRTYTGNELITVPKKALFTDFDGFPNEKAFRDFVSTLGKEDKYHLVCICVDVSTSNAAHGYAAGTFLLRQAYLQLAESFFTFRIYGNKFNLVVFEKDLEVAEAFLKSGAIQADAVYYGIWKQEPITSKNCNEIRRKCIEIMYKQEAKATKKQYREVRDDKIVGDKGNTPNELQETATCKFRATMWYGTITFEETTPAVRTIKAYVFPTEFKESLASLNMVAAVDDFISTRVYSGSRIEFGFDGIKVMITARFDRGGHLNIVCFKDRNSKGTCQIDIDLHEGNCIPANFGKRIGKGLEIYPFKPNAYGTFNYLLWDRKSQTVSLDEAGVVCMDGNNYAVYADQKSINLLKQ